MLQVERIYNVESEMSLNSVLKSIINDKIDVLIKEDYDNLKVNSTDSQKGEDVA